MVENVLGRFGLLKLAAAGGVFLLYTQLRTPAVSDDECLADLQCWGTRHVLYATNACKPLIERQAAYQAEWTDGTFETKMNGMRWLNEAAGSLTYTGDKIRFQNGFGAWRTMFYQCDFDPAVQRVIDVRVFPR